MKNLKKQFPVIATLLLISACDFSPDAIIGKKAGDNGPTSVNSYEILNESFQGSDDDDFFGFMNEGKVEFSDWSNKITGNDLSSVFDANFDQKYAPRKPTQAEIDATASLTKTRVPELFRVGSGANEVCSGEFTDISSLFVRPNSSGTYNFSLSTPAQRDFTLIFADLNKGTNTKRENILFVFCLSGKSDFTATCKPVKTCEAEKNAWGDYNLWNCDDVNDIKIVPPAEANTEWQFRSLVMRRHENGKTCRVRYGIGQEDLIDWSVPNAINEFNLSSKSRKVRNTEFQSIGLSI